MGVNFLLDLNGCIIGTIYKPNHSNKVANIFLDVNG